MPGIRRLRSEGKKTWNTNVISHDYLTGYQAHWRPTRATAHKYVAHGYTLLIRHSFENKNFNSTRNSEGKTAISYALNYMETIHAGTPPECCLIPCSQLPHTSQFCSNSRICNQDLVTFRAHHSKWSYHVRSVPPRDGRMHCSQIRLQFYS